ncbi:MAG: hypothetical protein ACOH2E_08025 [Candidatus Paracaedibacter sp.]
MEGYITMSKQELTRLEIIQKVTEKRMKQHQAAEQLDGAGGGVKEKPF